jgi:hypothetical protein
MNRFSQLLCASVRACARARVCARGWGQDVRTSEKLDNKAGHVRVPWYVQIIPDLLYLSSLLL